MQPTNINPQDVFIEESQLGLALINPNSDLSDPAILRSKEGNKYYLPRYKNADQNVGGQEHFAPTLDSDGTLTFYLESFAPSEVAGQLQGVLPYTSGTSMLFTYNQDGQIIEIPLTLQEQGNNIWKVSTKLNSTQNQEVISILFDPNPNANIQISQRVTVAGQLTEQFVQSNWSTPAIREKLLSQLAGAINIPSADMYYRLVQQEDPQFSHKYMTLVCDYVDQIGAPILPGYIQWSVSWKGKAYNYYQDNQHSNRVFFLPDSFKISKRPDGNSSASLLQFQTSDGTIEKMSATFRFFAEPVAEYARIENAREQIGQQIGANPETISMQDAQNVSTQLTLYLPTDDGNASRPTVQENAQINFRNGIINELSNMPFKAFQSLWDAIFNTAPEQPIFTGWVSVSIQNGKFEERINFDGRLDPNQKADYYYSILEEGTDTTYSKNLIVHTAEAIFTSETDTIIALSLDFGQQTVDLSKDQLNASVTVMRPVSDIILGDADSGTYPYTLEIIRLTHRNCCSRSTKKESFYIIKPDVDSCTGDCSD
jgi:hypothetical protein